MKDYFLIWEEDKIILVNLKKYLNIMLKRKWLRVIGYYQGEYFYTLSDQGMLISFKEYTIAERSNIALVA